MEAVTSPERQRARALAEEYRSRGYEVIDEPSPAQLPDFLSGYHPDLLVRKGDPVTTQTCSSEKAMRPSL
jgi:REase_AHJR-like protein